MWAVIKTWTNLSALSMSTDICPSGSVRAEKVCGSLCGMSPLTLLVKETMMTGYMTSQGQSQSMAVKPSKLLDWIQQMFETDKDSALHLINHSIRTPTKFAGLFELAR